MNSRLVAGAIRDPRRLYIRAAVVEVERVAFLPKRVNAGIRRRQVA
jgi:hypothetical protein